MASPFVRYWEIRKERNFIRKAFATYLAPTVVNQLLNRPDQLRLGGEVVEASVLFLDVAGFTTLSEQTQPEWLIQVLNRYLGTFSEIVFRRGGMVDKFIGDAVMALWGSTRFKPSDEGCRQDAINAVTASLAMREALEELNKSWRERGIAELKIGMGVHQGDVVVGNIGSESPYEKMDLTVIGDAVNLASRLEGVTKEYGVDLIISDAVQRHVQGAFHCRRADLVAVKGKAVPVEVFAVVGPATAPMPAGLETFEIGVRLYREGRFEEALAAFKVAAEQGLDDKLTQVYQERCLQLILHPPERWDGVFVMTKK
jgi:adenylate cyclase